MYLNQIRMEGVDLILLRKRKISTGDKKHQPNNYPTQTNTATPYTAPDTLRANRNKSRLPEEQI